MTDDRHESGLSVGQVADRMHLARSAVRWYADQGLLPCERTANNERRFYADAQCRIAMIRAAQRVGLTLDEIREALTALTPGRQPSKADWEQLSHRLREVVSRRIDELFALLDDLKPADAPAVHGQASRSARTPATQTTLPSGA